MFTQGVYYFEMIAMNKPQLYVDARSHCIYMAIVFSEGVF